MRWRCTDEPPIGTTHISRRGLPDVQITHDLLWSWMREGLSMRLWMTIGRFHMVMMGRHTYTLHISWRMSAQKPWSLLLPRRYVIIGHLMHLLIAQQPQQVLRSIDMLYAVIAYFLICCRYYRPHISRLRQFRIAAGGKICVFDIRSRQRFLLIRTRCYRAMKGSCGRRLSELTFRSPLGSMW